MPATPSATLPIEVVIPDCCNTGVIFRVLLAVNAALFIEMLLRSGGFHAGAAEFMQNAAMIEVACLGSLLSLCWLRRLIRYGPHWLQRIACAIVPAIVTAIVIRMVAQNANFAGNFPLPIVKGAIVAALLGAVLQYYLELRVRAYSPALVEAQLQALQARIRPHFLFNSLNAVLSLIRTEPRRAEATLEDLAELFRVLMRDARDLTSLDEEVRLCKQYLSIEQIRLGERLQVKWDTVDIPEEVMRRAKIPTLLLQPLVENAVHYGVEPARQPSLIQIEITRVFDRIEIAITNPCWSDEPPSGGNQMALTNIRQRLALLYDVEAQLTTLAVRGFFEVRLSIPYVKGA